MTNKFERDGKIAVLYSPGFGAGWSTWNQEHAEYLMFDAELVEAVLADSHQRAAEIAKQKISPEHACVLGAHDLQVQWLPKGTQFEITEYDGSESIRILANIDYFTA